MEELINKIVKLTKKNTTLHLENQRLKKSAKNIKK